MSVGEDQAAGGAGGRDWIVDVPLVVGQGFGGGHLLPAHLAVEVEL